MRSTGLRSTLFCIMRRKKRHLDPDSGRRPAGPDEEMSRFNKMRKELLREAGEKQGKRLLQKEHKAFLGTLLFSFAIFAVAVFYWEILLRVLTYGGMEKRNFAMLFFLPAEGAVLTALIGWKREAGNFNIFIRSLLLFLLGIYYTAQYVYFQMFSSYFSAGMAKMGGEALANFGWTLQDILRNSIPYFILIFLPAILSILVPVLLLVVKKRRDSQDGESIDVFERLASEIEKESDPDQDELMTLDVDDISEEDLEAEERGKLRSKSNLDKVYESINGGYPLWWKMPLLGVAVVLWLVGILGLRILGTERGSAYYVYHNSLADTDTTSERIGALTTSLVELGAMYFGDKGDNGPQTVDTAALLAMAERSKTDTLAEKAVSDNEEIEAYERKQELLARVWQDERFDMKKLGEECGNKQLQSLYQYYDGQVATGGNEYTGLFEGYNLIYICGEAFSNFGIDPAVTPTLYEMSQNGIVLHNYYNSFPNTTTNGEYALLAGQWPDLSRWADSGTAAGTFPQSAMNYMPYTLPGFYNRAGVSTYAYHNYEGQYYRRKWTWPNLGFQNIKFMHEGMEFTSNWPASDLEMFEQSVDDYIGQDQFQAYYMTFSGHGVYATYNSMYKKNHEEVLERLNGKYKDIGSIGYMCGEYELDQAMAYLLDRLEEAGKLENTVIVLAGDHYPYSLPESARTELNGGVPLDTRFEKFHSTCIIYNAGLEQPIETDTYCCNVDILPTILNLFDIPHDSRLIAGTDIFGQGIHHARLYNGSFLTEFVRYNASTGKAEWTEAADDWTEEERKTYLDAMCDYSQNEYAASLSVIKTNFYLDLYTRIGELSQEDLAAEKARVEEVKAGYAQQAQIEAEKAAAAASANEAAAAAAAEEAAAQGAEQGEIPAEGAVPEGTPVEGAPVENAPAENAPAQTAPAEIVPDQTPAAESVPEGTPAAN